MDNQNTNHNKNGSNKDDSQINIKRVEFDRSSRVNQKKSNGKWKNILQTTIRSMMVKDEEEGEEAAKKRVKGSSVTQIAKGAVAIGVITGGVTATQMTAFASDGEMVAEVHQGTTVAGEHEVTIEEAPAEQSSGQEVVETVVEQEIGSGTETTASASATSSEEVGQSEGSTSQSDSGGSESSSVSSSDSGSQSAADSNSISESLSGTDSDSAKESESNSVSASKSESDSVSASDSESVRLSEKESDSIRLSENASRSASESASTTESNSTSLSNSETESSSLSESGTDSSSLSNSGTDSLSTSESGTDSASLSLTGSESISLSSVQSESASLSGSESMSASQSVLESGSSYGSDSASSSLSAQESLSLSESESDVSFLDSIMTSIMESESLVDANRPQVLGARRMRMLYSGSPDEVVFVYSPDAALKTWGARGTDTALITDVTGTYNKVTKQITWKIKYASNIQHDYKSVYVGLYIDAGKNLGQVSDVQLDGVAMENSDQYNPVRPQNPVFSGNGQLDGTAYVSKDQMPNYVQNSTHRPRGDQGSHHEITFKTQFTGQSAKDLKDIELFFVAHTAPCETYKRNIEMGQITYADGKPLLTTWASGRGANLGGYSIKNGEGYCPGFESNEESRSNSTSISGSESHSRSQSLSDSAST
ncbi:MAG: hypothetical protein HXK85_08050, partial [Lachnospiraceae bacterium]|nr:hypothetical protein [Lachnospiraceae bacterium]